MKTAVMLIGIAAVFASGVACAKIYHSLTGGSDDAAVPAAAATPAKAPCAGLSGQALTDCESGATP
jgi:hypothetical protein